MFQTTRTQTTFFLTCLLLLAITAVGCAEGSEDTARAAALNAPDAQESEETPTPTPDEESEEGQSQEGEGEAEDGDPSEDGQEGEGAPEPTATPTPEPSPTPTPTPAPGATQVEAERAVYRAVSSCAGDLAADLGSMRLAFESAYDEADNSWRIDAYSSDFLIRFGAWEVAAGSNPEATPADRTAEVIASGEWACEEPIVLLESDAAPPRFVNPDLAVAGEDGGGSVAELRVWVAVYDCASPPVGGDAFSATRKTSDTWVVEGRADEGDTTEMYGLWLVSASGELSALDSEAASLATSGCFDPLD